MSPRGKGTIDTLTFSPNGAVSTEMLSTTVRPSRFCALRRAIRA